MTSSPVNNAKIPPPSPSSSPDTSTSSGGAASPYRRSRYRGMSRREALERRIGNSSTLSSNSPSNSPRKRTSTFGSKSPNREESKTSKIQPVPTLNSKDLMNNSGSPPLVQRKSQSLFGEGAATATEGNRQEGSEQEASVRVWYRPEPSIGNSQDESQSHPNFSPPPIHQTLSTDSTDSFMQQEAKKMAAGVLSDELENKSPGRKKMQRSPQQLQQMSLVQQRASMFESKSHNQSSLVQERAKAFGGVSSPTKSLSSRTRELYISPQGSKELTMTTRTSDTTSSHDTDTAANVMKTPTQIDHKRTISPAKSEAEGTRTTVETCTSSTQQQPIEDSGMEDHDMIGGGVQQQSQNKNYDVSDDAGGNSSELVNSMMTIPKSQPQHLMTTTTQTNTKETALSSSSVGNVRYYRIIYKGVVALLSEPDTTSSRSGAYIGYGEVVSSRYELEFSPHATFEDGAECVSTTPAPPLPTAGSTTAGVAATSPPRSVVSQHNAGSVSSLDTHRTASTVAAQQQKNSRHQKDHSSSSDVLPSLRKVIRVDDVLTGGYAVDATDVVSPSLSTASGNPSFTTPKRSNTVGLQYFPMVEPSPLPIMSASNANATTAAYLASTMLNDSTAGTTTTNTATPPPAAKSENNHATGGDLTTMSATAAMPHGHGYLFTQRKNVAIAEQIHTTPICQTGHFLYKVTASTPLKILTGPSLDSPKTKAMVLPGTVHEICLKFSIPDGSGDPSNDIIFLRLCHRRGWIADKKILSSGGNRKRSNHPKRCVPVMMDVTNDPGIKTSPGDEGSLGTLSSAMSSSITASAIATPGSTARRRHRPPRRKREKAAAAATTDTAVGVPRQLTSGPTASSMNNNMMTPVRHRHDYHQNHHGGGPAVSPLPKMLSPSSNISLLSDGSSFQANGSSEQQEQHHNHPPQQQQQQQQQQSPGSARQDSLAGRQMEPVMNSIPSVFLMRVNAPKGLKILDAPHFQVSSLIRGPTRAASPIVRGGAMPKQPSTAMFSHTNPSTRNIGNPAVFDGKKRILPRGALFEASTGMDTSAGYSQGAGLIKLGDNSGWAIVPHQEELEKQYKSYQGGAKSADTADSIARAYEEVGNAIQNDSASLSDSQHGRPSHEGAPGMSRIWLRVAARNGILVSCTPPVDDQANASPTLSKADSSDVASSVASAFLDGMFRTPKKTEQDRGIETGRETSLLTTKTGNDQKQMPHVIQCGMCVQIDRFVGNPDFVRLSGGQGWIPRQVNGKDSTVTGQRPEARYGSFWFRVKPERGVKVRLGPSRKATSIKSEAGVYFRFECGEYLRACEIMTVYDENGASESFAKLYRNRHAELLRYDNKEHRLLASLTSPAEWVQIHSADQTVYLEECAAPPHIQRHKKGWRYNAVADAGVEVRKGPSFSSELTGMVLLGGESVMVNERVTGPGERITWLRLSDSQGWVHDTGQHGDVTMIAHSLEHRKVGLSQSCRPPTGGGTGGDQDDDVAYNTIIARLFHGEGDEMEEVSNPKIKYK